MAFSLPMEQSDRVRYIYFDFEQIDVLIDWLTEQRLDWKDGLKYDWRILVGNTPENSHLWSAVFDLLQKKGDEEWWFWLNATTSGEIECCQKSARVDVCPIGTPLSQDELQELIGSANQ